MKQFTSEELKMSAHLNILDYGEPGSGKTYFSGKAMQAVDKALAIVVDSNELLTVNSMPNAPQYKSWVIENISDLWQSYVALRENKAGYELVIVDNLSALQKLSKTGIVSKKFGGQEDKTLEAMMSTNVKMEFDQWGQLQMNIEMFIDRLRSLDKFHLICIAQADTQESLRGGTKIYPAMQGGIRYTLASKFDLVFNSFVHTEGGKQYFCKTTRGSDTVIARDRFNLNRTFVNPDFQMFLDLVRGNSMPAPSDIEVRIDRMLQTVKPKEK